MGGEDSLISNYETEGNKRDISFIRKRDTSVRKEHKLVQFQTKEELFHVPSLMMINKIDDIN